MKATIKDNVLHLEIPMGTPHASRTGKTTIVASTHGNVKTDAKVNGKQLTVSVNAYVKRDGVAA